MTSDKPFLGQRAAVGSSTGTTYVTRAAQIPIPEVLEVSGHPGRMGPVGPQGPQGERGEKGDPGRLIIKGILSGNTYPPNGELGEMWIIGTPWEPPSWHRDDWFIAGCYPYDFPAIPTYGSVLLVIEDTNNPDNPTGRKWVNLGLPVQLPAADLEQYRRRG